MRGSSSTRWWSSAGRVAEAGQEQSWRFVGIARIALTHFVYHVAQIVLTRKILGLWPPAEE